LKEFETVHEQKINVGLYVCIIILHRLGLYPSSQQV